MMSYASIAAIPQTIPFPLQDLTTQELYAIRDRWLAEHRRVIDDAILVLAELGQEVRLRQHQVVVWRQGDVALSRTQRCLGRDVASQRYYYEHALLAVYKAGPRLEDIYLSGYRVCYYIWKAYEDGKLIIDQHPENVLVPGAWIDQVQAALPAAQERRAARKDRAIEDDRQALLGQLLAGQEDAIW